MLVKDGEVLGAMIKAKKFTRRGFADKLGWKSHTYLQRLIRGEVRSVTPDTAALISHFLDLDIDVLFDTKVSTIRGLDVDANRPRKTA